MRSTKGENMFNKINHLIIVTGLCLSAAAQAKTIRATDINAEALAQLATGEATELIIEFIKGDELPVTFSSTGDLFEITQQEASYITIKKDFWIKINKGHYTFSLNGSSYKPITEALTGSFKASLGSNNGPANAINLLLEAYLK